MSQDYTEGKGKTRNEKEFVHKELAVPKDSLSLKVLMKTIGVYIN